MFVQANVAHQIGKVALFPSRILKTGLGRRLTPAMAFSRDTLVHRGRDLLRMSVRDMAAYARASLQH